MRQRDYYLRLLFTYKDEASKVYVFQCINWEGKANLSRLFEICCTIYVTMT